MMNFSVRGMMNKHQGKDKVVVVLGATGTGKSRLAIDLATRFGAEVINSDKIQVYKGLDIVTNKVRNEECRGVPHHLLGIIDPEMDFTVHDFVHHALLATNAIVQKNRLPIIAGGSNSFIRHLSVTTLSFPPRPKVGWASLLSGSCKIPRYTFILWMAILDKLPTTDKTWLSHLGDCVLCDVCATETHSHIFFQCRFSRRCPSEVRRLVRFSWPNRDWTTDIEWASRKWRGKHIVNLAYRALLASCVYHIWRARNLRRFEHEEKTPSTLAFLIMEDVRQRILSINLAKFVSTCALFRLSCIPWPVEGETN
ncbi:UNVERIFIED_CONTAM: Adenylate isopentenyltransferase 5, chloroplastic [Sesamum indicum]